MEEETLDSYIKKTGDQELKGLLLKLRNELRKPEAAWDPVWRVMAAIRRKDRVEFARVADLIFK